jgi:hypothetical protein
LLVQDRGFRLSTAFLTPSDRWTRLVPPKSPNPPTIGINPQTIEVHKVRMERMPVDFVADFVRLSLIRLPECFVPRVAQRTSFAAGSLPPESSGASCRAPGDEIDGRIQAPEHSANEYAP